MEPTARMAATPMDAFTAVGGIEAHERAADHFERRAGDSEADGDLDAAAGQRKAAIAHRHAGRIDPEPSDSPEPRPSGAARPRK